MIEPSVQNTNQHGQLLGEPMLNWQGAKPPQGAPLNGRFCRLERIRPAHTADLYQAFSEDREGRLWTYLFREPFQDEADLATWVNRYAETTDPTMYAVIDAVTNRAIGVAAYYRINPKAGSIEVGPVIISPSFRCSAVTTEAMFLMMQHAFEALGYRRYEWRCDTLNEVSCRAAERLGFQLEGVFRQSVVYKNRNRDTAWYAIIDKDWATLKNRFQTWLAPENFDRNGKQRRRLAECQTNRFTVVK